MNTKPHYLIWSERVYRVLLLLYPAEFRRDYGSHMAQVFRDMCRESYRQGGGWAVANWWVDTFFDLLHTVIMEHRKAGLAMDRFTGWFCIAGGIFFAASSLSQFQTGLQAYQLSTATLIPGMVLITLGMLGIFFRYPQMDKFFGKLMLIIAISGTTMAAIGGLLTITLGLRFWSVLIIGLLIYLGAITNFGGFAATTRLLPKWRYVMLIGSVLPLTVAVLGFGAFGSANFGAFVMLLLIGISWILTGIALNSETDTAPNPSLTA